MLGSAPVLPSLGGLWRVVRTHVRAHRRGEALPVRRRISQVTGQRGRRTQQCADVLRLSRSVAGPEPYSMGHKTPLFDTHTQAGARMVDFGGWDMPVNYGSLIEEHHAV